MLRSIMSLTVSISLSLPPSQCMHNSNDLRPQRRPTSARCSWTAVVWYGGCCETWHQSWASLSGHGTRPTSMTHCRCASMDLIRCSLETWFSSLALTTNPQVVCVCVCVCVCVFVCVCVSYRWVMVMDDCFLLSLSLSLFLSLLQPSNRDMASCTWRYGWGRERRRWGHAGSVAGELRPSCATTSML